MSDLDNEELETTREIKELNKIISPEEKTADEMFEEIGYITKIVKTEKSEKYGELLTEEFIKESKYSISFKNLTKEVIIDGFSGIELDELKAINKKCKELRMDIITIPEPNMNENEIKFGIAIQNAILNGKCEKCKYLKQCENNKNFKFPNDSWCFNKYKEIMFK